MAFRHTIYISEQRWVSLAGYLPLLGPIRFDLIPYGGGMNKKRYGLGNFLVDAILTIITSGLWLIWIFVREMRR